MLNHITIMGRLTRDPELRFTKSDTPVATFSVAVDGDNKKTADQTTDVGKIDFFEVVAWRQTAEFVSKHLFKGSLVAVSGRMTMRQWVDNSGKKRVSPEIVADNVYFAERKQPQTAVDVDVSTTTYAELGDDEGGELPF